MLNKEYFPEKKYKLTGENDITEFDLVPDVNRCSSYKKEGIYCDSCFNQELIDKLESFSSLERLDFINHQINLYPDPLDYLKRLAAFLNDNGENFGSFSYSTVEEYKQIVRRGIQQLTQKETKPKESHAKNIEIFINSDRITDLEKINNPDFDLVRLIAVCKEINLAFENCSYISLIMLTRSLIDHIPPLFGQSNFANVYGQYGTKSFKESLKHLDASMRKIADSYMHTHIRRKESLPNITQVNFSQDLDVLLAEIIRKMNE